MNLWVEMKYAWRRSRKAWGYSIMCAGVVAVGMAATALAYSVTRALTFPQSSRSRRWYSVQTATDRMAVPQARIDAFSYQELLKLEHSADHLGAFADHAVDLERRGGNIRLRAALITPRLLAALAARPLFGRIFEDLDGQPGAAAVAILTFDTWQQHFAGDPAVVGQTVRLDGALVRIIGVMPENFRAFQNFELWLPLKMPCLSKPQDRPMMLSPLIEVGEHQSIQTILYEMKSAVEAVNRRYPDSFNPGRYLALVPARRMFMNGPVLGIFNAMVAAVVLLGCVNISMVFMARLLERSRELALRTALGASRLHLLRQCLLETGYTVLFGLLAGYALAVMAIRWCHSGAVFERQILGLGAPLMEIRLQGIWIAVCAAIATWLLSTLIPAWRATKQSAATVLTGSGKGVLTRVADGKLRFLVVLQVLISSVTLASSVSVAVAIDRKMSQPAGLNAAGVMMTDSHATAIERDSGKLAAALERQVPGVETAFTTMVPTRPRNIAVLIERTHAPNKRTKLPHTVVSEDYFRLLGIAVRSGRLFARTDGRDSPGVAIVDETMAARHWPGRDVVGQRIRLNPSENGPWLTIVGLVSAVADKSYYPDVGTLYLPLRQAAPPEVRLLIKAHGPAADAGVPLVLDEELQFRNLQKLDDYLAALDITLTGMRSVMIVIVFIIALLVISGLFGLIGRSVAQRTHDVGIRRALGATRWRAMSRFVRQGLLYLSVAAAGVTIAIVVSPLLDTIVEHVTDYVVRVGFSVVAFMAVVIGLASYLPCRRALALAPGDALRHD